ncbi:MAG TPA: formylglycine-generating enzyme family protein [Pyrinomonadaceae bacterium]|jgi:formylglycine-generating enzyme required for sulfatase activity|nr:formylglycine-generating enzyme family protein [Pyrinomonadaceae bacterium]
MQVQSTTRPALIAAALALLLVNAAGHRHAGSRAAASGARAKSAVVRGGPMSLVRGATFRMGTDASQSPSLMQAFGVKRAELFSSEAPRHAVTLSPFYIDRHEVTNALYKKFLDKNPRWRHGSIEPRQHNGNYLKHWHGDYYPEGKADHPVTNVSWYAAVAYCRWAGKRLPTEAEWEYAARGGLRDRTFPWGDEPADKTRANYAGSGVGGTTRVGSYPANGYGLFDMAGNVWEYTLDEWGTYPSSPQVNPVAGGNLFLDETFLNVTTRRVIRGGSYGGAPVNLRTAYRDSHPPDGARDFVGFRCAKPAPSAKPRRTN